MSISDELLEVSRKLEKYIGYVSTDLETLGKEVSKADQSWARQWLGNKSRIYYEGLEIPPANACYNDYYPSGRWEIFPFDHVIEIIKERAGNPDLDAIDNEEKNAESCFEESKDKILSTINANFNIKDDAYLEKITSEVEHLKIHSINDFVRHRKPNSIVGDLSDIQKGVLTPPHIHLWATIQSTYDTFRTCEKLYKKTKNIAHYIYNLEKKTLKKNRVGTNIFIGHGRSLIWRELKDFVNDRLRLPYDEFNSVPIAGISNQVRLAEMLDQACFAFLIMTAEDEQTDGKHHARMNVVHEIGLFQGRLGFERAIILLEDGCEEFSNVHGLGQIRFPKGNISAIFEEVRRVLERENIID